MTDVVQQTLALRQDLMRLADTPDWALLCRNDLLRHTPPEGSGERAWRRVKAGLARLGWMPPHVSAYSWVPTVKHGHMAAEARPLVIWALGAGRDDLRTACRAIQQRLAERPGWAPVLATDVADFAFYSRLGWLVEFLPMLRDAEGDAYRQRKRRHLAWRYSHALHVPMAVAAADDAAWNTLVAVKRTEPEVVAGAA